MWNKNRRHFLTTERLLINSVAVFVSICLSKLLQKKRCQMFINWNTTKATVFLLNLLVYWPMIIEARNNILRWFDFHNICNHFIFNLFNICFSIQPALIILMRIFICRWRTFNERPASRTLNSSRWNKRHFRMLIVLGATVPPENGQFKEETETPPKFPTFLNNSSDLIILAILGAVVALILIIMIIWCVSLCRRWERILSFIQIKNFCCKSERSRECIKVIFSEQYPSSINMAKIIKCCMNSSHKTEIIVPSSKLLL